MKSFAFSRQQWLAVGGAAIGLALLILLYYTVRLTRDVPSRWADSANPIDGWQVKRKLGLLDNALQQSRPGHIRLSALEINSYLRHQLGPLLRSDTNAPVQVLASSVDLLTNGLIFTCSVRREVLGQPFHFLWERNLEISRGGGRPLDFEVKSMRVGQVEIVPALWRRVETFFQAADKSFEKELRWIQDVPKVEIAMNELTLQPELRLYTQAPAPAAPDAAR